MSEKNSPSDKSRLQEKIVNRTTQIVHLTHNDLDAAGCDAICRIKFGEGIMTFFGSVGKFSWLLGQIASCNGKGDTLILSDLGYQKGIETQIKKAYAAGWKIQWFDHHKWLDEEKALIEPFVEKLVVDNSRCATGVLARAFTPDNADALEMARVVCDYDLWKHEDPRSAVLGIVTSGAENLKLVRDKFVQGIIVDGQIDAIYQKIERAKNKCIKKSQKRAQVFDDGKYKIAVMPAYGYPSEAAAESRKKFGTDIELLVFDNGKFSIRSVPEISHMIAKEFGGGGHPNASGGSFNYTRWEKVKFKIFKKLSRVDKFVETTKKY
ncbi:MAG TPA: phosphoesterase [Methanocorpusculum sp.]|nr:phosphoesterase [Methanocorpusculum sp.]